MTDWQRRLVEALESGRPLRVDIPPVHRGMDSIEKGAWQVLAGMLGRGGAVAFPNEDVAARVMARARELAEKHYPELFVLDDTETDVQA